MSINNETTFVFILVSPARIKINIYIALYIKMMSSSSFQKIIVGMTVFLLFAQLAVSSSNNPISEKSAETDYKLICTDPVDDVKNYTTKETVENNETVERPNIDLKEIYMKHNETALFVKINVLGEIESSPWVGYRLSFESNESINLHGSLFVFKNVDIRCKNGTATFEGKENRSVENYSVNSSLILKIPIVYFQDEGCIKNNSLRIVGGAACELGAEKIDDEWVTKYFYYDALDHRMGCYYFFSLGAKIISVTPNSAVLGEPVQFTGVGGDPYENVTYEWWSSIDGFLTNEKSFATRNLSASNHTIYFRVRNSTAMVEKTVNVTVEEASPTTFVDDQGDVKDRETDEIIDRPNIDIANFSVISGYSSLIISITVYGKIEDLNGTRYYVDFGEWIVNGNKVTKVVWYENGTAFYEENNDRHTITVYHDNKTITFEIPQTCEWGWDIGYTIRNVGAKDEYGYDECYYSYFFPSPNISINISITPNPAIEGETICFTGTCNLSGNLNYEWKSSIDGLLSNKSSFSTDNLSVGNHTITFTVWEGNAYFMIVEKYAFTSTTLTVLPKSEEGKNDMLYEHVGTIVGICILIGMLLKIKRKSVTRR